MQTNSNAVYEGKEKIVNMSKLQQPDISIDLYASKKKEAKVNEHKQ